MHTDIDNDNGVTSAQKLSRQGNICLKFVMLIGHQGELILKNFQKLPMDTQGFPCVTLTKRYDLVWDSGGAV